MIDVIIRAYNCSKTIEKSLSSLVAQTDDDFNVIIVDDCSVEDIKSIIDRFSESLNIKYIRNEVNSGLSISRQVGIDNSTSKFITFLDVDDMLMPFAIETFNSVIKANPNIEFLHTHFYHQRYINGEAELVYWKDNFTACHGKLYNMDCIRKYGIKNSPKVIWNDDALFNSICAELLKVSALRVPTYLYTYNKDSMLNCDNPYREENKIDDFLTAMELSVDFVLKYKSTINHLDATIGNLLEDPTLSDKNRERINKLLERIG
jgi:glycosyltransferase involved in cell wall biosynthesis